MNSEMVHAPSWRAPRARHRSKVERANASDTRLAEAARAACSDIPTDYGRVPGPLEARLCEQRNVIGSVGPVDRTRRRIPEATVARLPVYLRTLVEVNAEQVATISSERLAELAGVNAAKVRKDLSYLGSYGTRGVGYDVEYLLFQMSRELGLTKDWPVVIVGIGNLGAALANYGGFGERGFPVAALVDADPGKVGEKVGDMT